MTTKIITQVKQSESDANDTFKTDEDFDFEQEIEVCNPVVHGEGKEKYTDYEIRIKECSPLYKRLKIGNESIRRRYKDFVWLYEQLNAQRINLPDLPGKQLNIPMMPLVNKFVSRNFSDSFIKRRCKLLEKFLNKLASLPLCQGQKSFIAFLEDPKLNK